MPFVGEIMTTQQNLTLLRAELTEILATIKEHPLYGPGVAEAAKGWRSGDSRAMEDKLGDLDAAESFIAELAGRVEEASEYASHL